MLMLKLNKIIEKFLNTDGKYPDAVPFVMQVASGKCRCLKEEFIEVHLCEKV